MRISSIMFTVGLLALATPAVAQSLDPTARSIGVDAKTRAKFKRLQQLRLKRPKSRRPVKDYTALTDEKTMSAVGTLREAIDGMVLLSVPIDAATADKSQLGAGSNKTLCGKSAAHSSSRRSSLKTTTVWSSRCSRLVISAPSSRARATSSAGSARAAVVTTHTSLCGALTNSTMRSGAALCCSM